MPGITRKPSSHIKSQSRKVEINDFVFMSNCQVPVSDFNLSKVVLKRAVFIGVKIKRWYLSQVRRKFFMSKSVFNA